LWCDVLGKTNDCDVIQTAGPYGCISLASSADGKRFGGGAALFQDQADNQALDAAGPGSKIELHDCIG
jgi:hypothetical protein